MTVRDFYFKFQDADSAVVALGSLGFYRRADGELTHDNRLVSVDEVGSVYKPTGEVAVIEGERVEVMTRVEGYHINVRTMDCDIAANLSASPALVAPETPIRRWA